MSSICERAPRTMMSALSSDVSAGWKARMTEYFPK